MKFSITIGRGTDGWKIAKRAEELGFHAVWLEDSQMVAADPFVMMAVIAMHTSRIRLGTTALIPSNRIAPQTANSVASLNSFAPGRMNMAIATGFSGRRAMGLGPVKMNDLRTYVEIVQALLRSETVEWEFESHRRKIRFVNADRQVTNLTDPIDIYVCAQGPKMRRLTAALETHWMSIYSTLDTAAADFDDMRRARIEAGSAPDAFRSVITVSGCPLASGETVDSPRARRQAGPLAAVWVHNLLETEHGTLGTETGFDLGLLEKYRKVYQAYEPADARYLSLHRGHAMFLRDDEAEFITGDWIRRTTMTAPVAELRERIRELKNIGYQEVTFLSSYDPADADMLERWAEVVEGV